LHADWQRPNEQVSPVAQSLFIPQVLPGGVLWMPLLHPTSVRAIASAAATSKYLQTSLRVPALDDMLAS
jgi:hypothetical protein